MAGSEDWREPLQIPLLLLPVPGRGGWRRRGHPGLLLLNGTFPPPREAWGRRCSLATPLWVWSAIFFKSTQVSAAQLGCHIWNMWRASMAWPAQLVFHLHATGAFQFENRPNTHVPSRVHMPITHTGSRLASQGLPFWPSSVSFPPAGAAQAPHRPR